MPCLVSVTPLQLLCFKLLANFIKTLGEDSKVIVYDLSSVVSYFSHLPNCLKATIYNTFLEEYRKSLKKDFLNEKHLLMSIYLNDELYMNEFEKTVHYISMFKGDHLKKVTFNSNILNYPESEGEPLNRLSLYQPLYTFMNSLCNLTAFHSTKVCDDNMFIIFSQNCPALEEIDVEICYNLSDEGVSSLCGFNSAKEAKSALRTGDIIQRKTVCRNLKKVTLDYTLASNLSTAVLLHWCSKLEYLSITPDNNISDVFTMLYGCDSSTYDSITKKFMLTTLKSYLEIDESVLSLIAQTCPNLKNITLRCYGRQRRDKNLIANLLDLPIQSLSLMNCNTEILLWYLSKKGHNLLELDVEHLISAPPTVYLDRSHLQSLIKFCPNLETFTLKMCGNVSISPNVPYSSFGSELKYFTSLHALIIEGVNLQPEDLKILVQKSCYLREVRLMCQSLEVLEDYLLYQLLSEGALSNLRTLYVFRPLLTMAGLRRLLAECPHLQTVGPLSSWAIPKKDRDELFREIKQNNWDLNIDTPENQVFAFF